MDAGSAHPVYLEARNLKKISKIKKKPAAALILRSLTQRYKRNSNIEHLFEMGETVVDEILALTIRVRDDGCSHEKNETKNVVPLVHK